MLSVCVALGLVTGCSVAKSAMGVLSPKPRPVEVTVVNNVEPVVVRDAAPKKKQRSFFEKVGIVTTSTVVGAGLGALAGDALDQDAAASALVGAGVGAVAGVAIADE